MEFKVQTVVKFVLNLHVTSVIINNFYKPTKIAKIWVDNFLRMCIFPKLCLVDVAEYFSRVFLKYVQKMKQ